MIPTLHWARATFGPPRVQDFTAVRRTLRPKIASFWRFNGTLADTGRAGVTMGGPGTYTTGPGGLANDALAADPAARSVITTKGMSAFHTGQAFSFGGFFRSTGPSSTPFRYVNGAGTSTRWQLQKNNPSGWGVRFVIGGSAETLYSGDNSTDWVFVVITMNNGLTNVYLDGAVAVSTTLSVGSLTAATDRYEMLTDSTDVSRLFFAHDELTADEVSYLYNNGNGRDASDFMTVAYGTTPDAYALTLGLSGYWKFNESSGSSAADSASGLGAATLTNGAAFINSIDPPAGFDAADYVADFDGTNDYANLPDLNYAAGSLSDTFFGWFNADALNAGENYWRAGT
jgi:hypothetical protein